MKDVIFTICAKNYLAQALALKGSIKKINPDKDFYIFLSDSPGKVHNESLIYLDDSWIPGWQHMAFKYNVIEFSTSIKPFCIEYLFKNYNKVIYLDPDTYVLSDIDIIFDDLDNKDVVISPHYCEIEEHFTGAVSEEEILFVGIYNLGFLAIRNSAIGNKIVNWWKDRLSNKCYADKFDGLHVDQKWFDFIPAFFPDEVLISHNFGINTAIWNLHERALKIVDGKYIVENTHTKKDFLLVFFHFSGFNPKNPTLINRRHPKYNVTAFPTFEPLFNTYTKEVINNNFDEYSNMAYGFNSYINGEKITPLHRRIFRKIEQQILFSNPFDNDDNFYLLLKKSKLLTGEIISESTGSNPNISRNVDDQLKKGELALLWLKRILGVKLFYYMLLFFSDYYRMEKQTFLLNEKFLKQISKR